MPQLKTHNRIAEVRKARGLSQTELGRRIGKSEPTINRYERGNRKPTREVLNDIAEALGVPLKALFVDLSANGDNRVVEGETDERLQRERQEMGATVS